MTDDAAGRLSAALEDRYRVERELGAGGMATVYLARDLKHGRDVAVKVLRPEIASAVGGERFLREIETTAGLRHPHILPLYDSGEADGFLYYVMPLVEGESLHERLARERQLPVEQAVAIAREVADALGYAHARGLVHRDVKPANIMLESGHAVLTDFGIARALSGIGGDRLTGTGVSIGTPVYMSPEQAAGDEEVDRRSDLYSLGCVLYEMLAGQPPFTGPTAEAVSRQHLIAMPAPITNLRSTVPDAVADVLDQALAKNAADRFDTAERFIDALSAGRPTGSPARAAARQRAPRVALVAGVVLTVGVVGWLGSRALPGSAGDGTFGRIAVLPLDNQTGDSAQIFFANGMTREVIGVLTDVEVRVLGYRAVTPYANSTATTAQIARELDVDAVVTGAVLRAGDVVQVAAELTDPETDENLWSRTFTSEARDVVTLQREMALEIARGIHARLSPDQEEVLAAAPPVDPVAYAEYLLGQEQLNLRTVESITRSIEHLDRSTSLDESFGPAWATLAMAHAMGFFYGVIPPDSARVTTAGATQRAIALDESLGDAWIARGLMSFLLDWDFVAAAEDFRLGMERSPTPLAQAFYTYFPWGTAQPVEATRAVLPLIDAEPTTAQWQSDAAWIRWAAGDSAEARAYALRARELDSTFAEPNMVLAFVEADAGNAAAARRAVSRAIAMNPYLPMNRGLEGYVMARAGDTEGARRVLEGLRRDGMLANQALVHAALGEKDAMYDLFEQAIDAREPDVLWYLNAHPALRAWRLEPRYQELLERMGLPEELRR